MIAGIGVDVCDVARWTAAVTRQPKLAGRVLTPAEAALRPESQAARWAAKEALYKALGGVDGWSWQDAEVVVDERGKPGFAVSGAVAARAEALGVTAIHLSLTHDAGVAVAFVVCEGNVDTAERNAG